MCVLVDVETEHDLTMVYEEIDQETVMQPASVISGVDELALVLDSIEGNQFITDIPSTYRFLLYF